MIKQKVEKFWRDFRDEIELLSLAPKISKRSKLHAVAVLEPRPFGPAVARRCYRQLYRG